MTFKTAILGIIKKKKQELKKAIANCKTQTMWYLEGAYFYTLSEIELILVPPNPLVVNF